MKKEYMMMTVLITEDPGRSIDVYLRPLVDELKDLWTNGVRTYDKSTGKMFTLRTAVMWTMNDFPAYAMISGWSTKGYMACPVCKEDVTSAWHAGKVCYLGHRRWLPWDHEWREKDKQFDGNTERRLRPREWSGDEILEQLNRLDFSLFGKTVSRTRPSTHMNWTHKPMFFELPYWSKLKLRHNLDVMHVEKNVFDTLVGTILYIEGKTKDTIKAHLDLERMGIRRGLWMNMDSDKARRDLAFFSMKPNDKKEFLKFVSSVKFPDGYASNIARCMNVDESKFAGLKTHVVVHFFSQLTAKTLRKKDMFQLCHDIVQVLCKFEMIFPSAFFTSMMHVMVHLPEEALLAGFVNYRWMYPTERLLGELKKVYATGDRAKPKGSIIEAWVQYESLTFCGMYLKDVETASNRPQRNNDGAGSGWKVVHKMDHRNVYAIPELDPTDNDVDNVADQRLESSMENDAETLRDTNVIQEPFRIQGVSSIEIPIQSITIDLGDLPRYDVAVGPSNDDDVVIEEEEEDWETESDDSDDNESYYSSDDE
ncbi:unnamed protein product [Prunus brigantina]